MFMTSASSVFAAKNESGGPSTMCWPPVRSTNRPPLNP